MADLGAFGAAVKELDRSARDSFTFFGDRYEVVGAIPAVLMLQLGAAASGKIPEQDMFAAIWEALRLSLDEPDPEEPEGESQDGPADAEGPKPVKQFNRFYKIAVGKACDMESLMRLVMALFQATDGRPTEAVPGSGPGPQSTSPSSSGSSSTLQAFPGMTPVSELLAGTG